MKALVAVACVAVIAAVGYFFVGEYRVYRAEAKIVKEAEIEANLRRLCIDDKPRDQLPILCDIVWAKGLPRAPKSHFEAKEIAKAEAAAAKRAERQAAQVRRAEAAAAKEAEEQAAQALQAAKDDCRPIVAETDRRLADPKSIWAFYSLTRMAECAGVLDTPEARETLAKARKLVGSAL